MPRFIHALACLFILGLVLPVFAQDAKKADPVKKDAEAKDDKKKDDKDAKDQWVPVGQLEGKLLQMDEEKRTLKLEVTTYVPKLNVGEQQAMINAQIALQQAARIANPQQRAQEIAKHQFEYQQHAAKLYTQEKKTQKFDLEALEDAKVRTTNPPIAFDNDGKVKKYTTKELNELKGSDPKVPGYPSEFSGLSTEQYVTVTVVMKKKDKDALMKGGAKVGGVGVGAPKPKDLAQVDGISDNVLHVSLILVMQPPAQK